MSVTEWRHSAISALIVVLVLSTAADAVWTPFPCSFLDSQGRYFDLSNMYRNHSSTSQADYQYYTGTTVFVNVCGQTAPGYCKPENGVCAVSGSSIGWGNAQYATWKPYSVAGSSAVGVTITYTRGFACSSTEHTSILNIACTSSGGDGQISSVSTSGCVHTINMSSKWACPTERPKPVPAAQRNALVELFNSTRGSGWTRNTNWVYTPDPCFNQWQGVTCVYRSGYGTVVGLELAGAGLRGTIPSTIGDLSDLTMLDLSANTLYSSIPNSIVRLAALETIRLSHNALNGTLPSNIGSLHLLRELSLSNNLISGALPSSVSDLATLETCDVSFNRLESSIPSALLQLSHLSYLSMGTNKLSGAIPTWSNSLVHIDLSSNLFTKLPKISANSALEYLRLSDNQFEGPLPELPSSLVYLDLAYNRFNGTIYQSLSDLQYLFLNNNHLSAPFPPFLQQRPNMRGLALQNNRFACQAVPQWCMDPPSGDGTCSPCEELLCCYYTNGAFKFGICAADQCPDIQGYKLDHSTNTSSCSVCQSSSPAALLGSDGKIRFN